MRSSSLLYLCGLLSLIAAEAGLDDDNFDLPLSDIENDPEAPEQVRTDSAPKSIKTKPFVEPSSPSTPPFLRDTFQTAGLGNWQSVSNEKFKGRWDVKTRSQDWIVGDKGLVMLDDSSYHGLARKLNEEFSSEKNQDFYGTMEVQFEKQHNCGGAYFKLFHTDTLSSSEEERAETGTSGSISKFDDTTPYSIMFGPDQCGFMTNKVHLIIKYENPMEKGAFVEEHLTNTIKIPTTDPKAAHQYGFALHSNGAVELYQDGQIVFNGTMKSSFRTNFEAAKTITDAEAKKPADWVEDAEIIDTTATKPDDWDEDAPMEIEDEDAVMPDGWDETAEPMIPNPDAVKPEDWDDETDGEWIRPKMKNPACYVGCGKWRRPMKANPDYKGKWTAPKIPNPDYKGPWEAPKIPNPKYYNIENPWNIIRNFNAIGFELWTVEGGAIFDNIFLTKDKADFETFIKETYGSKKEVEHDNYAALSESPSNEEGKKGQQEGEGLFTRLVSQAQSFGKGQSTPVVALAMGLPIACVGYLLNRFVRKSTAKVVSHKKTDEAAEAPKEKDAADEKAEDDTKETEPTGTSTSSTLKRRQPGENAE